MVFCSGCELPGTYWAQGEIPESTEGEDLVMGEAADNVFSLNCYYKYSFNPIIATNHSNQLVCSLVYENMVELDNDFNVIPNIVTEWKCNESATAWTLTIDTTRTFHDGTNVRARDVGYSIERSINSDRFSGRFRAYGGYTTLGNDTLVVSLAVPDTQMIKLLNLPVIKYSSYGDKYPQGTGPYTYVYDEPVVTETVNSKTGEVETKTEDPKAIQLTAYEGHPSYDSLPVKNIYLKSYTEAEDIINAFEDSYIDVVINDPSSYSNLGYASTNEFHPYVTTNMHYIMFNEDNFVSSLPGFRYAMQFAFDRAEIVDLLHGYAIDSAIPMYPTVDIYPDSLADALGYDLTKCKTILENNGFIDADDDGWLEYMGGEIDVQFMLCQDSSAKAGIATRFQEDMASIGLKVTLQQLAWDDYYNALTDYEEVSDIYKEAEGYEEIEWDMYYGETKVRNNFDINELLVERKDENHYTCINYSHSKGNDYESLLTAYLSASDANREPNYRAFAEYILTTKAQLVVIGFEHQQLITHRAAVRGVDPNMGNPLYNFQNWRIQFNQAEGTEVIKDKDDEVEMITDVDVNKNETVSVESMFGEGKTIDPTKAIAASAGNAELAAAADAEAAAKAAEEEAAKAAEAAAKEESKG